MRRNIYISKEDAKVFEEVKQHLKYGESMSDLIVKLLKAYLAAKVQKEDK